MSNNNPQVFARLAKVDESKRLVYGVIADETVDNAGEIFDYTTSKEHFQKWSDRVAKASDGKSVGNVRAQHGSVVAGKLNQITFDDAKKQIEVVAEIVDDNEMKKVLKGCYTGFSIGGAYVGDRWEDKVLKGKRYTAAPSEVSIVDLGCNPAATFQIMKADGTTAETKFEPVTQDKIDFLTKQLEELKKGKQPEAVAYLEDLVKAAGDVLKKRDEDAKKAEDDAKKKELEKKELESQTDLQKSIGSAITKALSPFVDDLNKSREQVNSNFEKLTKRMDEQDKLLKKVSEAPVGGGPAQLAAVSKAADVASGVEDGGAQPVLDGDGKVDKVATLIKAAHATGGKAYLR